MVGKWHLGYGPGYHPNDRGFDEFFGFLNGLNNYARHADDDPRELTPEGKPRPGHVFGRQAPVFRQREVVDEPRYLTEAFAQESVAFIDRQASAGKPFFLYVAFNAPHSPLEPNEKYLDRFSGLPEGRRGYAALVSEMDDAVGKVVAKLRERNIEENTLIFFLSDNGGQTKYSAVNKPLRGRKGTFYEGGVRVPFFVQWKGHIAAGRTISQPVISLDILPTALAAANIRHVGDKPLDGRNLLGLLCGETDSPPHEMLYWRYHNHFAARDARWKLIEIAGRPPRLFDLLNGPYETTDVAGEHPDIVERLSRSIEEWNATLEKPRWVRTVKTPDGGKIQQLAGSWSE